MLARGHLPCLTGIVEAYGVATFVPQPDGQTRVELEHRHIDRHGAGAASIHRGVGGPGGWSGTMENYAKVAAAA